MTSEHLLNSYDEWTQLEEVIVGSVGDSVRFHLEPSFNLFFWENIRSFLSLKGFFRDGGGNTAWPTITIESRTVEELKEDIEGFVAALESAGVTVRRPSPLAGNQDIQTPFWRTVQSPPLNVRDQTIILGTTIVETAPHVRARLFENDYLKPLFLEYFRCGARWVAMPRPALPCGVLDKSYFNLSQEEESALVDDCATGLPGLAKELVFDGAQCIRLGRDILVNIGTRTHEMGLYWLRQMFGDRFVFHCLNRMADTHIDSVLLPLRPGLWLVREPKYIDMLPRSFQKWDYVVAPSRITTAFHPTNTANCPSQASS